MGPGVHVGIDENGLGPRLGPLVVTGVAATFRDAVAIRWLRSQSRWPRALDDSKALVDCHDSSLGEAWARALLKRHGQVLPTPDAIVRALSIDASATLRAPCPPHLVTQCWSVDGEALSASDAHVDKLARILDGLAAKGIDLGVPRVVLTCTRRLNDAADAGVSRFDVDLRAMERLVLDARERAREEISVVCGKVGGYDFYDEAFVELSGHLRTEIVAGRAKSTYAFPRLCTVSFERDADAGHALVAMASLVGKWVRDLLMRRVARFYRVEDASLPEPSGYHDPVTARFIESTRDARVRLAVVDACFERKRVAPKPPSAKRRRSDASASPAQQVISSEPR